MDLIHIVAPIANYPELMHSLCYLYTYYSLFFTAVVELV